MSLITWVFLAIGGMAAVGVAFAMLSPANGAATTINSNRMTGKSGARSKGEKGNSNNTDEGGERVPPLKGDYARAYEGGPSFTDMLPWLEYIPESKQIMLIDAVTRVAMYEVEPLPTEGRTREYLKEAVDSVSQMIAETFPEHKKNPWVFQIYVSGEGDLTPFMDRIKEYIKPEIQETEFTQEFLKVYGEHLDDVTVDTGYFEDDIVTKSLWRGRNNRIRVVLYRRYTDRVSSGHSPENELTDVCERFESNLDGTGIRHRRMTGQDFYYWMLFWFNPRPSVADGKVSELRNVAPYPGDSNLPLGSDLSEMLCMTPPRTDVKKGYMYFDDLPHAVLQVINIRSAPRPGHITGEDESTGSCMFDRLPEGTTVSYSLTVAAQDEILNRITVVRDRAVGDTAESRMKREDSEAVMDRQNAGDKIYPVEMCIYVRGEDDADLKKKLNTTRALMSKNGFITVEVAAEAVPIDNYIKNLPGVYNPSIDQKSRRKANPYFVSHAAALAPVFGRSRGTNNPGLLFFNRSGEPCCADPLNYEDRTKSAHLMTFGPTGAGKSATVLWMLMTMLAVHRPRVFIVETGNSFGLFGDYIKKHGLTSHKTALSMNSDVSIPPFINAMKLLEVEEPRIDEIADDYDVELEQERSQLEIDEVKRDYLGEMELTAQIMITGGEKDERLSRAQRLAIRKGLVNAAATVRETYGADGIVIPQDLADELNKLAQHEDFAHQASQVAEMSQALQLFCGGLNGHLFNRREGHLWPEVDVNIIDLAQSAGEGSGDTLDVAYVSLLQNVNGILERDQFEERHTIFLTDEGHLIMNRYLLPIIIMKATKMWRKVGGWFWLATQNIEDLSESATKMLSMIEWWVCLAMPREEVEQMSRFRDMTEEEKHMMRNAVKNPGKYVEGVLMSEKVRTLFRNVPPSLPLALAMTEKPEKAERYQIIKEHGLSGPYAELEAAEIVGRRIRARRLNIPEDVVSKTVRPKENNVSPIVEDIVA